MKRKGKELKQHPRRNMVLREVAAAIESERKETKKDTGQGINFINFVQAGQEKCGGKASARGC